MEKSKCESDNQDEQERYIHLSTPQESSVYFIIRKHGGGEEERRTTSCPDGFDSDLSAQDRLPLLGHGRQDIHQPRKLFETIRLRYLGPNGVEGDICGGFARRLGGMDLLLVVIDKSVDDGGTDEEMKLWLRYG